MNILKNCLVHLLVLMVLPFLFLWYVADALTAGRSRENNE